MAASWLPHIKSCGTAPGRVHAEHIATAAGLDWCLTSWRPLLLPHEQVGIPPAPRGVPQIEVTFDIDGGFSQGLM